MVTYCCGELMERRAGADGEKGWSLMRVSGSTDGGERKVQPTVLLSVLGKLIRDLGAVAVAKMARRMTLGAVL